MAAASGDAQQSQEIMEQPKIISMSGPARPRRNRRLDATSVGGHLFSLLPSLEGKWSGSTRDWKDNDHSSSIKIAYRDSEGVWEVRTTTSPPTGPATVLTVLLEPTSHGCCKVLAADGTTSQSITSTYEERAGDLFGTITQRCVTTGALERIEVWALSSKDGEENLTRTSTVYSAGGGLDNLFMSSERKVPPS